MNAGLLVAALGVAQIVSWGTLFYAIGVLGAPMREELGTQELVLFGSFTAGLLLSGALSPLAGRMIDARGGRVVLSAGSILGAASMALLASSRTPAMMALGWLIAGAAMAACLYDPAFATLSQHTGSRYRQAVSALTLFGGFASTVFWPVSQLFLEQFGWRHSFMIYAAMHLLVCLPIHLFIVPGHHGPRDVAAASAHAAPVARPDRARLRYLIASLAMTSFVTGVIAIHVIGLLTEAGLTAKEAVGVSMLFGPMQVLGRVIDMGFARRIKAVSAGFVAFCLMAIALAALIAVHDLGAAALVFAIAYGAGNGVLTIVRGTVPAELFGRDSIGALLGNVSRATVLARALAPAAFSALLAFGLTRSAALDFLLCVALVSIACYYAAVRNAG